LNVEGIHHLGEPQLHYVRPPVGPAHPKAASPTRWTKTRMKI
jgi:hypothetical protein